MSAVLNVLVVDTLFFFFFQAEDGIRDAQESRGLGDVYKRQDRDRSVLNLRVQGAYVNAVMSCWHEVTDPPEQDLSLIHI